MGRAPGFQPIEALFVVPLSSLSQGEHWARLHTTYRLAKADLSDLGGPLLRIHIRIWRIHTLVHRPRAHTTIHATTMHQILESPLYSDLYKKRTSALTFQNFYHHHTPPA